MGFFDSLVNGISKKAEDMREESAKASERASTMSSGSICTVLGSGATTYAEKTGYSKELKNRARLMSDSELKDLFRNNYRRKNSTACLVLAPFLKNRGYLEYDGKSYKQIGNWY